MLAPRKEELSDAGGDGEELIEKQIAILFTEEPVAIDDTVLKWRKLHASRFPDLAKVARKYLSVPGTSVPSEVVFSAAGTLVTKL